MHRCARLSNTCRITMCRAAVRTPARFGCATEPASLHLLDVPGIIGTEHLVIGPYFGATLIVVKPFPVETVVMFSRFVSSTLAVSCD